MCETWCCGPVTGFQRALGDGAEGFQTNLTPKSCCLLTGSSIQSINHAIVSSFTHSCSACPCNSHLHTRTHNHLPLADHVHNTVSETSLQRSPTPPRTHHSDYHPRLALPPSSQNTFSKYSQSKFMYATPFTHTTPSRTYILTHTHTLHTHATPSPSQASWYSDSSHCIVGSPGPGCRHITGADLLNNTMVNLVSAAITSASTGALALVMMRA